MADVDPTRKLNMYHLASALENARKLYDAFRPIGDDAGMVLGDNMSHIAEAFLREFYIFQQVILETEWRLRSGELGARMQAAPRNLGEWAKHTFSAPMRRSWLNEFWIRYASLKWDTAMAGSRCARRTDTCASCSLPT